MEAVEYLARCKHMQVPRGWDTLAWLMQVACEVAQKRLVKPIEAKNFFHVKHGSYLYFPDVTVSNMYRIHHHGWF